MKVKTQYLFLNRNILQSYMASYKAFKVDRLQDGQIIKVSIARPKAMNAMNPDFFSELEQIFTSINTFEDVRVVILVGEGKVFTAGLDLKEFGGLFAFDSSMDSAKVSIVLYEKIKNMQKQFLSIVECRVPVIMGIHSHCVGGGMDLISMGDIRYCTKDALFSIKEIDIGMAADLGTLQILPHLIGNQSAYRQLAFTGKPIGSQEAQRIGLVNKIFENKADLDAALLETAQLIAAKSPVGIYTLKQVMKRQLYKKIHESLEYMARTNSAMLLTKDTMESISAFLQKRKAIFPKL